MNHFPAHLSLFCLWCETAVKPRAVAIYILEPAFKERLYLSRAPQPAQHPISSPPSGLAPSYLGLTVTVRPNPLIPEFQLMMLTGHHKSEVHWEPEPAIFFFECVCGKAKETPVPVENKEDLGLFVIKAVCVSLRKSKVWCPLGSICKAFSQQTFSHHRQMPSVLQLGANGFCTANFTAVSNAVIEEARGISYNKTI